MIEAGNRSSAKWYKNGKLTLMLSGILFIYASFQRRESIVKSIIKSNQPDIQSVERWDNLRIRLGRLLGRLEQIWKCLCDED